MKKKQLSIILAAALLVLLAALYAFVSWRQEQDSQAELKAQEERQVYVTDLGEVTGITIENGDSTLDFVLADGSWQYAPDSDCPLRQSSLEDLAQTLSKLPAERILEEPDGLEAYGLDTPSIRFIITAGDSTASLLIGSPVPSPDASSPDGGGEQYYACLLGGTQVYTIGPSLFEMASQDLYGFIQTESLPYLSGAQIRDITVTKSGVSSHFVKKDVDEEGNIAWYRDSSQSEENRLEDNGQLNNLADAVAGLSFSSCASYKADEEELISFGLAEPAMTITWSGEDGNAQTLLIGSLDADGAYYYAKLSDSQAVNRIPKSAGDRCLNAAYPQQAAS